MSFLPPSSAVSHKLAQVGVRPAHRDLDDAMQTVELHVRPHVDSPPDGRFAGAEHDFQLVEQRPAASDWETLWWMREGYRPCVFSKTAR